MYVYFKSEPRLYTVGFFDPVTRKFNPESDHDNKDEAAARVAFLNGSGPPAPPPAVDEG